MLPPGCMRAACYLAAHGVLRGSSLGQELAEMPGTAHLVSDRASCPMWVRGDGGKAERHRLPPGSCRQRWPSPEGPPHHSRVP